MSVALNCNTHSPEDIEVISNFVKMRLKTKQLAGHYITCVRYLLTNIQCVLFGQLSSGFMLSLKS